MEVDLLEVVSHCVDQAALSVSASHVLAWLRGVDYIANTCARSKQNVQDAFFFQDTPYLLTDVTICNPGKTFFT